MLTRIINAKNLINIVESGLSVWLQTLALEQFLSHPETVHADAHFLRNPSPPFVAAKFLLSTEISLLQTAQTNSPHFLQFIFHSDMREKESLHTAHFLRHFFGTSTWSLRYRFSFKPLLRSKLCIWLTKSTRSRSKLLWHRCALLQSQLRHVNHIHMPERSSLSTTTNSDWYKLPRTRPDSRLRSSWPGSLVTCWPKTHSLRRLASTNLSCH